MKPTKRISSSKNGALVISVNKEDFERVIEYLKPDERYCCKANTERHIYLDYPKCRFILRLIPERKDGIFD